MRFVTLLGLLTLLPGALAAFGINTTSCAITVDTGASLVFKINPLDGNMISLVYNGVQFSSEMSS